MNSIRSKRSHLWRY